MSSNFKENVLKVVQQIPAGEVLTYKQVAQKTGRPKAYRAVGTILKSNYDLSIPCHRVVLSSGKIGQYNRGVMLKSKLLIVEKSNKVQKTSIRAKDCCRQLQ